MSVQFFWYLKYGAVSSTISLAEYVAKLPLKYDSLRNFPEHASGYIFYDEAIMNYQIFLDRHHLNSIIPSSLR